MAEGKGLAVDKAELRRVVADLLYAAGCSCCRNDTAWYAAQAELARLLDVPAYADQSGFDFSKFMSGALISNEGKT